MSRPFLLTHRHIGANPRVVCTYWSPAHDAAYLDCVARSAGVDELDSDWELVGHPSTVAGFDPATVYPDRAAFSAIVLRP